MTDIEQRNAAAAKEFNTACQDDESQSLVLSGGTIKTIRELLAPSPQAPDSVVEEAVKYLSIDLKRILENDKDFAFKAAFNTLIRAAQQPRQEWKTMESAPIDGTRFLFTNGDVIGTGLYITRKHFAADSWQGSRDTKPTHWQPLPSPPKEKT